MSAHRGGQRARIPPDVVPKIFEPLIHTKSFARPRAADGAQDVEMPGGTITWSASSIGRDLHPLAPRQARRPRPDRRALGNARLRSPRRRRPSGSISRRLFPHADSKLRVSNPSFYSLHSAKAESRLQSSSLPWPPLSRCGMPQIRADAGRRLRSPLSHKGNRR